ncbi:MAG: metal-dependent transcriptional regulator [Thermoplasmata archaeon]
MNLTELGLTEREMDTLMATKKIYSQGWPARVATLSRELNVRPPTVEEYINSLISKGYLEKNAGIVRLTPLGDGIVRRIERNHRIIETFLYRMGMDVNEACENATKMQYYSTEDFINYLCNLLGHPHQCPHGKEIPPDESCCKKPQTMEIVLKR